MENRKKLLVAGILLGMFLVGLFYVGEAGVYFDEEPERQILSMNVLQYGDFLHLNLISEWCRSRGMIPICESVERDHGIAAYYLYVPALVLLEERPDLQSATWHLYTYLLFFTGVVYLYRLLKEVFRSRKTALAGAAMFFFTPRIFADGLYNNKDTVLLSLVIVMLFYGVRFLDRRDCRSAVLLGLSAGLAGNLKISGIYVFAMVGLYYLVSLTLQKQWNRRTFLAGVVAAGTGFGCYLLLTPAVWGQGFHLIEFIKWNLSNATDFSRLDGTVLFEGEVYRHSVNPLPWYYLPEIMVLTIPVYITLLIAGSVAVWIRNLRKRGGWSEQLYPLFAMIAVIPVVAAMVSSPNIYNGWRHFYFIYGPLMFLAVYTVHWLLQAGERKKTATAVLGLCLVVQMFGIAINGIGSTAYMNFLAGGKAEGRYELDYYGVTTKKILMNLVDQYGKIYIYSDSRGAVIVNWRALPPAYRDQIVPVSTENDRKQAREEGEEVFRFENTSYDLVDAETVGVPEGAVEEWRAWGNIYAKVYRY